MQSALISGSNSSIYVPAIAQVQKIEQMTELEKLFTLKLSNHHSLGNQPGQFIEISLLGIGEAPISVTSSPSRSNGTFELCIRRVGDLTNALHQLKPGQEVGIRGPFGHGFSTEIMQGKDVLFVAGGLGMAPLRSLINQVLDNRGHFKRVIILYGTKQPSEILFKDEIQAWAKQDDLEFYITVDRADEDWQGNVGVITTLFPALALNPRNTVVAICGPPIMYRFVLMELMSKGIPETQIYLSLERHMKCGVGKCGHCQINNLYCCLDGPVFRYADIKGIEEAL